MSSSIIQARVMHQRLRPAKHRFVYPVFMLRLDLDELCAPNSSLASALFGINRWRPVSIHFKDYGPRDGTNLKIWLLNLLDAHQIKDIQKIELLTFPRVFGYAFNPISIWYCYNSQTQLQAVLAEVNNTFGEHHFYLLSDVGSAAITADTELVSKKMMHVSPFCEIKGHYQFQFTEFDEKLKVNIDYYDEDGLLLQTAIIGKKQPHSNRLLLAALSKQPLLTLGVVFRIHWQALLLWCKRVTFHRQAHITNQQVTTGNTIDKGQIK